jgi:hypothetical protein
MASESDFQLQNSLQAIEYSREAVRSGVLINGGAAVALLGLIGAGSRSVDAGELIWSLQIFCYGVIAAAAAAAVGYFAQTEFARNNRRVISGEPSNEKWAIMLTLFGVLLVLGAFACFLLGVSAAGESLFPVKP